MHHSIGHRIALGVLLLGAGSVLPTGCTAEDASPTPTVTVTAATLDGSSAAASGTAAASTSAVPGTTTAGTPSASAVRVDPDAPAGQCADGVLDVSVQHDPEGDGAGQRGAFVVLRNTGRTACTLEGAPGLSLVGGRNGAQIGAPAQRSTAGAKPVRIAPGAAALAAVTYTYIDGQGGNFNDGHGGQVACRSKAADGYRVYPPHSYRAFFSAARTYACSTDVHWIAVGTVRAASAYPYFTPTS